MRADAATGYPGRGYRYFTGEPLFPAFAGMSYTSFATTCAKKEATATTGNRTMVLSCSVANTGKRDGDAVLLLFHHPPRAAAGQKQRPVRRLLDFDRVAVPAGGKAAAREFAVDIPRQLMLPSESGAPTEVAGVHVLEVQDGPSFRVPL